jgi:hypothetical protein
MEKADRALEVKRIMRDIMRLSKEELRREISSRQDSMEYTAVPFTYST